jgi:hypothetical protein
MSVISMFRKEALRHQYKTQEFGHSVIKQPNIISYFIVGLCVVMLVIFIAIHYVTLATNNIYSLKISIENYYPLVKAESVVITDQLATAGTRVNKGQPIANLSMIDDLSQSKSSYYLKAPVAGIYFQTLSDSMLVAAYQPIGYLLRNTSKNDFLFWLQEKPRKPIRVGESVSLIIDQKPIEGRVSMVVGTFIKGKGQKISIRLNNINHLSLLSPTADLQMLLKRQPKTIRQLLG